jgi:predicted nuclease of predicted toxin-antitoxin system
MRFKVDENLPIEVAELLIAGAHDAVTVNDEGLQGTSDARLAEICQAEDRVLVTLDIGFADIRNYPPQSLPGLIVLRLGSLDRNHILDTMRRTMPLMGKEPLAQHLWIVEETQIRIRQSQE